MSVSGQKPACVGWESKLTLNQSASAPSAGAVLLAIPSGGDEALLWSPVAGRPLLAWSLNALRATPEIGPIALVVPRSRLDDAARLIATEAYTDTRALALPPGVPLAAVLQLARTTRVPGPPAGESGLAAIPRGNKVSRHRGVRRTPAAGEVETPNVIVLHDAARPFVQADHLAALIVAAAETGVAVSAEPVKETIKRVDDGRVVETLPRDELALLIPPLALRADAMRALAAAPERPSPKGFMEYVAAALGLGIAVRSVALAGSPTRAVSSPADMVMAEALLRRAPSGTAE